ncbi:MAG: type I DNA topoisomerase [Clostridia bacterium]|nr:type I DNA topoisomerase [Clostridia bacterium]
MANNLVIVESPSKAKSIGKYLGKNYTVVASMGHIRDLPKSKIGVDIEHDFKPEYITIRGKGDIVSALKKAAKKAKKVFLATDPDREGEAISWHLAYLLNIDENAKCRISFNEVTKSAVVASIKEARAIDKSLVDAQQARRVLDRIVGYKISPLLWSNVRSGLSAGRVQSVATRLVVDREAEIEAFVPEEYWIITAHLTDQNGKNPFEARFYGMDGKKQDIRGSEAAKEVLKRIEGAQYTVQRVTYGERVKNPAPPFTTSTLQQEASRKMGFTAKRTMSTAQSLYEGVSVPGKGVTGLITYMRTDSLRVAAEAQQAAVELIGARYGKEYLPRNPRVYKTSKAAQDAHEAIRPTEVEILPEDIRSSVSTDEYRLYKLIWERFVSSQMASAVYDTLSADINANGVTFRATESAVRFAGYRAVYIEGSDENERKDVKKLVKLEEKMPLKLVKLTDEQKFTEAPPRYTEASLIKAMEENGIGRPSTYAPTISTILGRDYVSREKKMLYPTELGKVVTDLMKAHFPDIVDINFTANMEQQLDDIENGSEDYLELMRTFYAPFKATLDIAEKEIGKVEIKDEESDEICEKCGKRMVVKMGRYGKFLACPGYPECSNAKPLFVDTGVPCPKCGARIVAKKSKRGKKYFGCEKAPACDFVLWDEPNKEPCEKCGAVTVTKYGKYGRKVICTNEECEANKKQPEK